MSVISKGSLFPAELEKEIFNAVKGHSSLAKLSGQDPLPFVGKDIFAFTFDKGVEIVGENSAKAPGDGTVAPVSMKPIKVVYQMRTSDEFINATDEYQMNILSAFADGFEKKLGNGLDIMAMHGVNPANGTRASTAIPTMYFDGMVTNSVTFAAATADDNIEDAVALVEAAEYDVNGCAIAPAMRSALAKIENNAGDKAHPEFGFGACPAQFGTMKLDKNASVSANSNLARAYVGDFENAFKWGIAKELPVEIIEFGDPDGQGDLKRYNQIVLRSEAYIGWAIMDKNAFAKVVAAS